MPISTFADGFGRRSRPEADGEPPVETLRLCDELSNLDGVEAVLAERIVELSAFIHPGFAATRSVERGPGGVTLTSDGVPGTRLSEILRAAERDWIDPDLPAALAVLRQVAATVAALHDHGRQLAHGTLGPERIVLRDDGVAVVVEGALGAALERSESTRTMLWRQYRVAVPAVAGAPSLAQATDVMQLGMLALALARGRLLGRDDFPARLPALLQEAGIADPLGNRPAVPKPVHSWIARTLQLDARTAFRSAREAEIALSQALGESGLDRAPGQSVAADSALAAPATVPPAPPPAASGPRPRSRRPESGAPTARGRKARPGRRVRVLAGVAGLVLLCGGAYLGARSLLGLPSLLSPTGHLAVESRPAGLDVLVDGKLKGITPLDMELRAGRHTLALRSVRSTTLVPVTVESGAWHTERIEVRRGRTPKRTSTVRRASETSPPRGK
jgi:hypothetical protein